MISDEEFVNAVQCRIGTVLESFGYELVAHGGYYVRFERVGFFAEVDYDPWRSCEVSIWLDQHSVSIEPPLELADVLRAAGAAEADVCFAELIQTCDGAALTRLLGRAAELLRGVLVQFLGGDNRPYIAAHALRSQRSAQYTSALRNAAAIREADAAWEEGDFSQVHALLNPIRNGLDARHRRRLEFAEMRL